MEVKFKGGVKLRHKELQGFSPIIKMINSDLAKLDVLTVESLKGFMLKLDVEDNDSEYLGLSKSNRFEKPITSFILKFAVITPSNDQMLPSYNGINKNSESNQSYFDEAKLQYSVWKKSIYYGRPAICPAVVNLSFLDNSNANNFCDFMLKKETRRLLNKNVENIFIYFKSLLSDPVNQLGIITMPTIEKSQTLLSFSRSLIGRSDKDIMIKDIYGKAAALIARLFLDIGVIHLDLHPGNILVFEKEPNIYEPIIIDFGRALIIPEEYTDKLNELKIYYYHQMYEINKAIYNPPELKNKPKADFINNVIDEIASIDQQINQAKYYYSKPHYYQMDWIEPFLRGNYQAIVFDNLYDMTAVDVDRKGSKPLTIKSYELSGLLPNFEQEPEDFYANVPSPVYTSIKPCVSYVESCVISGGKKTRKSKKNAKQIKKRNKSKKRHNTTKSRHVVSGNK